MKNKFLFTLLGIIIFTFLLRSYKLSSVPYGLYIDETSIGYNAFSITKTGKDEYGKSFPIFFQAFGEYKLPVYIYSVAFVQIFTGPTDFSVRLPALVFGILSVWFVYFLAKEMFRNLDNNYVRSLAPYLASIMLGLSPWHYQFARAGFEASAAIFFLIFGLYLFFLSIRLKSSLYFSGFVLSFAMALYSYNSARIVIPAIFTILLVTHLKSLRGIKISYGLLTGLVFTLPFILFVFSPEGMIRAQQVSIFYQPIDETPIFLQFIVNYWKNISPFYLFNWGDPTIAHLTTHRMGLIYLIDLPFLVLGVLFLIRKFTAISFLIICSVIVSIIPSAVSTLNPHALRSSLVIPFLCLISAIGFSVFVSLFKNFLTRKVFVVVYILSAVFIAINFVNVYQNKYARDSGWDWQAGIKSAVNLISGQGAIYSDIYFDEGISKTAVLWYLKYNPKDYQLAPDKDNVGKYHFWLKYAPGVTGERKSLFITTQVPTNAKFIGNVYYPNGSVAYGIWEI